jgi:hypothetical protein
MAVETADDPEAIYKEMIQAAADAGKKPEWIIDYFLDAGREDEAINRLAIP